VRKSGFAPGISYIHLSRWADDGPWGVELAPETPPAKSGVR
jgi:hypothetical protein